MARRVSLIDMRGLIQNGGGKMKAGSPLPGVRRAGGVDLKLVTRGRRARGRNFKLENHTRDNNLPVPRRIPTSRFAFLQSNANLGLATLAGSGDIPYGGKPKVLARGSAPREVTR